MGRRFKSEGNQRQASEASPAGSATRRTTRRSSSRRTSPRCGDPRRTRRPRPFEVASVAAADQDLEDIARLVDPLVRGWMNYYGRFYRSKCVQILRHLNLNDALVGWAC